MHLEELKEKQIEQLNKKGWSVQSNAEIALHLTEEVGEVCEAIRENQSQDAFADELADVLWHLNRLCSINGINLEEAFLKKLEKNEDR